MTHPMHKAGRLLLGLLWLAGCTTAPLPGLEQELRRLERPVLLADLEQTAGDLQGDERLDRARLELVPGSAAAPRPLADGWLLTLDREGQKWLCWLKLQQAASGSEPGVGSAELLAAGRELQVLDQAGDRVLVLEHEAGPPDVRRLVDARPGKGREILAEDSADRLRVSEEGHVLYQAEGQAPKHFVEGPGSWHLEQARRIQRQGSGWSLGKPQPAETPYRCLTRFVEAARAGNWSRAKREVVLERLLALPGGGFSRELAASLRLTAPALLEKNRPLQAPPQGPLLRFGDLAGHSAWRVQFEERRDSAGQAAWKLVRLQTVEKP